MKVRTTVVLLPDEGPEDRGKPGKWLLDCSDEELRDSLREAVAEIATFESLAAKAIEDLVSGKGFDMTRVMATLQRAKKSFDELTKSKDRALALHRRALDARL